MSDPKYTSKPVEGDVIRSAKFQYGYDANFGKDEIVHISNHAGESSEVSMGTGKYDPDTGKQIRQIINYNRDDESRATALFIVEHAKMEGGGGRLGDEYPNGWHIKARRLTPDGKYNPEGELIDFYMSGWFRDLVKEVELIDHWVSHKVFLSPNEWELVGSTELPFGEYFSDGTQLFRKI